MNKQFKDKVDAALKNIVSIRETVHSLIIESLVDVYKTRNTEYAVYLLNQLGSVKGSFRVQAVVFFYAKIAGLKVSLKDDEYTATLNLEFTHDKKLLAVCKLIENRFWKIAPDERVLTFCDISTVFNGAVTQLARALKAEKISKREVQEQIDGLSALIAVSANSKTTFEWLEKFKSQNKDEILEAVSSSKDKGSMSEKLQDSENKIIEELSESESEELMDELEALQEATTLEKATNNEGA